MKYSIKVALLMIIGASVILIGCKKEIPKTGLYIGKQYLEGTIAYILQPGDPGYVDSMPHGLIAAPYDQSPGIVWCSGNYTNTDAKDTALGTGKLNTARIIASQHTGNYAANICVTVALGDSGGWYLPSLDELNKLYINQAAIGGFSNAYYWSSTEDTAEQAWLIDFSSGYFDSGYKAWPSGRVRAVRTF